MPVRLPRSSLSELAAAYANVRDYGALGNGYDDTDAIQRAIDNRDGKHVLFPQGDMVLVPDANGTHLEIRPYRIEGSLQFKHDGQRTLFLAGAFLQLVTDGTSVQITGKAQEFTGLRIQTGTARYDAEDHAVTAIPDPCLLIDGADGLLLSDLYVACGSAAVLVRIENTVGIAIQGGKIYGVNPGGGNTGLVFGGGVRQFGALCLTIDNSSYGVIFEGSAETIAFENSDVEQQAENAILLRPGAFVRGLSLIGLHTESGYGALRAIVVESGAGVYGAIIAGCEFGNLREGTREPRRVFDIAGDWHGVNVLGCYHRGAEWGQGEMGLDRVVYEAVYELRSTASVSQSCDMFNQWDTIEVATGDNKASLPVLQNESGGNMVFTTSGISIAASRIGFFGVEPVTRGATYYVRPFDQAPLARLLRGLAQLGLVGCEEY